MGYKLDNSGAGSKIFKTLENDYDLFAPKLFSGEVLFQIRIVSGMAKYRQSK